jgi:hypothetical protein
MRLKSSLPSAMAILLLISLNASAEPVAAGVWEQTSSTAGDCPSCEITITKRTPHIIELAANNQWLGYAYYSSQNDNYVGAFEWQAGAGDAYQGVVFTVVLVYEGRTLKMNAKSDKLNFTATYRKK